MNPTVGIEDLPRFCVEARDFGSTHSGRSSATDRDLSKGFGVGHASALSRCANQQQSAPVCPPSWLSNTDAARPAAATAQKIRPARHQSMVSPVWVIMRPGAPSALRPLHIRHRKSTLLFGTSASCHKETKIEEIPRF
jgi:hypothetical protein